MAAIVIYFEMNFFLAIWISYALMPFIDSLMPLDDSNVKKEA
jgi:hypothetical protein